MIVPQPTANSRATKLTGQKAPLQPKEVWAIRIRLQLAQRIRDLALFNLAIDSKLRGCDLVAMRVRDVFHSGQVTARAIIMQKKRLARFSSKSRSRHGLRSPPGFIIKDWLRTTFCLRVESSRHRICLDDNMRDS